MSCSRPIPPRSAAPNALRQWHSALTLWIWVLAGTNVALPSAAQTSEGGTQSPSQGAVGSPSSGSPAAGAGTTPVFPGAGTTPVFPGAAPETLPPLPVSGFGIPNPAAPPYSINNEIPTLVSPTTLRLLPPHASVVPLQEYDATAPAILFQPRVSLGEIFTDNVNYVHSPRKFGAITTLGAGASISADTPRLQAVATGQANGNVYLPSSNSSLNQVFGTFYGNGHGTIIPDTLFVDAQSTITQSTALPGFGFQNLSTLPRNQLTQQFINNVSPYVVKSFDGLVDSELRYTFSSSNYGGNTAIVTSPLVPGRQNNLSSGTLNEGSFIAATGQDFERVLARFTADALEFNSTSTAQNTQVSAFNDLEYRFTPTIAALGRAGYQKSALSAFSGGEFCRRDLVGRRSSRNRRSGPAGFCKP